MAKLIKAATARKRAEAVDLVQQELDQIAGDIAFSAARGQLSLVTYVNTAYEDGVVTALEKAGYVVTYPEYEYMLSTFGLNSKEPKNWLQRLLAKVFRDTDGDITVLPHAAGARRHEEIHISWGPAYHPVDPSNIEIIESM